MLASVEANNAVSANEVEDQPEPDTTLFVKNLNFDTTDDTMRQHFESCGPIFSATVARKKDPKHPGEFLSMGYGFVQFRTKKATLAALKELQSSELDGHVIELKVPIGLVSQDSDCLFMNQFFFQRSSRAEKKDEDVITSRKVSSKNNKEPISSKLLVRNIPFEATTKEVAELFKYEISKFKCRS